MAQGFKQVDEAIALTIERRILPSIQRQDEGAAMAAVFRMRDRYGGAAVAGVIEKLMGEHQWFFACMAMNAPEETRQNIEAASHELVAEKLLAAGLRLEDHYRVCDQGVAMTYAAIDVIRQTGFPRADEFGGNVSIEGMGISRSGAFVHPLTEAQDANGQTFVNGLGFASMAISAANGWVESGDGGKTARETIASTVAIAAPTVDVDRMLFQARYDDRVLLRLASLISKGFDALAAKSFGA